jgi:hypothetical protein
MVRHLLRDLELAAVVNDLLEQALAPGGPYEVLQRIRRLSPGESVDGSENMSEKIKAKLRRKYSRAKRPG